MKKIIVSLIVIASITFSANAQIQRDNNKNDAQKEYGKHHGKKDHKEMAENLDLTSDQKQRMKSINMDFKNKMKELKNSNLSQTELKAKREALLGERKEKMMTILTSEQKNKFNEFKKEEGKENKMKSGERMEKMKEHLSLTDDQVKKLNEQKELYRSKEEVIKSNQALSIDQRQTQLKALREERKNDFKSILKPEQAKKMEEMKSKRMSKPV